MERTHGVGKNSRQRHSPKQERSSVERSTVPPWRVWGIKWLELRRLPPIMGFVGSEGQGW